MTNARTSVATIAMALITGLMMALLVVLMPAPAKAQPGDSLQLLRIKATNLEDAEPDLFDEPQIRVDGTIVWNGDLRAGDVANLSGVPAQPIFGDNALISLWERDTGHILNPDDLLGEFFAEYTGGTSRTQTINYHNGTAVYEITYVVNRSDQGGGNTPPTIEFPKPMGKVRDRTPLIGATVRDAQTDLTQGHIKLFVDGRAKVFSYDAATDRLSYRSGKLAYGKHTVMVEATDGELEASKSWGFKVVKKRR